MEYIKTLSKSYWVIRKKISKVNSKRKMWQLTDAVSVMPQNYKFGILFVELII